MDRVLCYHLGKNRVIVITFLSLLTVRLRMGAGQFFITLICALCLNQKQEGKHIRPVRTYWKGA